MRPSDDRRLIIKIMAAQDAEARARRLVAKMGRHVAELLARAHAAGLSDAALARALLRRKHGRVTLAMKRREVERLRKRRRRAGTARPRLSTELAVQPTWEPVPSMSEVDTMSRLVKRTTTTTTTEQYGEDDEVLDEQCDDDEASASAEDDDQEEDDSEQDDESEDDE